MVVRAGVNPFCVFKFGPGGPRCGKCHTHAGRFLADNSCVRRLADIYAFSICYAVSNAFADPYAHRTVVSGHAFARA